MPLLCLTKPCLLKAVRLRGERQGAAAPLATPSRGFAPGDPDSMPPCAERLMWMLPLCLAKRVKYNGSAQRKHVPMR
jgi:hypothetical protein